MGAAKHGISSHLGQWQRLGPLGLVLIASVARAGYVGSKACAECHAELYRQYAATPMARSSGAVPGPAVTAGAVRHSTSGAEYRINAGARIEFHRGGVNGYRDAAFFIGSGAAARTFLWRSGEFLFELPVTWYASQGWEMSPGYESGSTINLARAIEPECLNCHATGIRHRAGTKNGYDWPPVAEGGIGCERCHGPGGDHAARGSKMAIVNPAKLAPRLRDSVCAQCHLTGAERVARAGRDLADFRPGQDINDYAVSFVWTGPQADDVHTTSHFERLAASRCKQASGDKLWCGTCHDPHRTTARAAFYRQKCMSCHQGSPHVAESADCISCHMPRRRAKDAGRASFTDHSIPRRRDSPPAASVERDLKAFGGEASSRELGIAWARIDPGRALEPLRRAYAAGARDAALLTPLAYLEDREGNSERATALYEQVRKLDPAQAEALVNLGSARAAAGQIDEAIGLWREATRRNPGIEAAWIKLALANAARGDTRQALADARTCLNNHPDSAQARELVEKLEVSRR